MRKNLKLPLEFMINKLEHVSESTNVFCKMVLNPKLRYTDDEKNIGQTLQLKSARIYRYLKQKLKIKLPYQQSLKN